MEATLKTTGYDCYYKSFSQSLRKEASQDAVVPDTLPDIGEILCAAGDVLIRSKDVTEGRVRVDANLPAKVLCRSEDGAVFSVEVNVPFSAAAEDAEIGADDLCACALYLVSLDARLLNPRKVTVSASVCFALDCYRKGCAAFCGGVETEGAGIHVLEKSVSVSPICAVLEKTFVLTDDFTLPDGGPCAAEILGSHVSFQTEDFKTVGNKIILKGSAKSCLLWQSADGAAASGEFETAFSQIIEAESLPDAPSFRANVMASGAYFEPETDGDGHSLKMELHLVVQLTVYAERTAEYLADAYSNCYMLELGTEQRELTTLKKELSLRETLRETIAVPQPVAEIVFSCAWSGAPEADGGEVTVPVTVCLGYKCPEGDLHAAKKIFTLKLETETEAGELLQPCEVGLQELYVSPSAGGAELRLPVEVKAFLLHRETVNCISAMSYDADSLLNLSDRPALVLLKADNNSDLWQLARENHSTVEAIRTVNGLDDLGAVWEKLLLIPRIAQ